MCTSRLKPHGPEVSLLRQQHRGLPASASVRLLGCAKAALDVVLDQFLKVLCNTFASERDGLLAVDVDRSGRRFASTGEADADVGMLAFARTVDDASHHGHPHCLDAGIA